MLTKKITRLKLLTNFMFVDVVAGNKKQQKSRHFSEVTAFLLFDYLSNNEKVLFFRGGNYTSEISD